MTELFEWLQGVALRGDKVFANTFPYQEEGDAERALRKHVERVPWGEGKSNALALEVASLVDSVETGRDVSVAHIPVDLSGFAPATQLILTALQSIASGSTLTYGELGALAQCASPRAVGTAMRKNRCPLLLPCHRVVRKGGVGNYSGEGGQEKKQQLLRLEKRAGKKKNV